ncbi:hypothetical protein HYALB_00006048 [Hymenoscyphus albidus]|uniref:2EXR domain-containing protein n=1 Tax=Hymenoscyphus albidus TaxID=595503 RepID=A0A9N9Q7D6_9HELO|nr:hypothetical protein HYALB_00006048 [Hymenoscyphus albidus]
MAPSLPGTDTTRSKSEEIPPLTYTGQELALHIKNRLPLRWPWTPPPPPNTFPQFAKLPAELRLLIWTYALPKCRIVRILWDPEIEAYRGVSAMENSLFKPIPAPPVLHVNRESRCQGLKFYRLAFATSPSNSRIYFDYDKDWATITWPWWQGGVDISLPLTTFGNLDFTCTRRLCIPERDFWRLRRRHFADLAPFSSLYQIYIEHRDDGDHASSKLVPNGEFPSRDKAVDDLLERVRKGTLLNYCNKGVGGYRWPMLLGKDDPSRYWYESWNILHKLRPIHHLKWPDMLDLYIDLVYSSNPHPNFAEKTRLAKLKLEQLWPRIDEQFELQKSKSKKKTGP